MIFVFVLLVALPYGHKSRHGPSVTSYDPTGKSLLPLRKSSNAMLVDSSSSYVRPSYVRPPLVSPSALFRPMNYSSSYIDPEESISSYSRPLESSVYNIAPMGSTASYFRPIGSMSSYLERMDSSSSAYVGPLDPSTSYVNPTRSGSPAVPRFEHNMFFPSPDPYVACELCEEYNRRYNRNQRMSNDTEDTQEDPTRNDSSVTVLMSPSGQLNDVDYTESNWTNDQSPPEQPCLECSNRRGNYTFGRTYPIFVNIFRARIG